jgi:hypothetical protein
MVIVRSLDRLIVKHSPFSCGRPEPDRWLKEQAGQKDRRDGARTVLALDEAEARVTGHRVRGRGGGRDRRGRGLLLPQARPPSSA